MMRKGQVHAAGVNIKRLSEILHGHRRAFNVPAGTPRPDTRFPEMLARFRRLPHCEITRVVFFVLIHVHARAGLHSGHVDFGKLSVSGELRDSEIDGAFALVSKTLFLQLLDQRDHVFDVICRADQLLGHLDMQCVNILEEPADVFVGVFANADSGGGRRLDDTVVHVGDVHHLHHAQALRFQESPQHVLEHERAKVSDMRGGVDGRPARVNAHFTRVNRVERLQVVGQRIVEAYLDHICATRKTIIVSDASPGSKPSSATSLRSLP